MQCILNHGKSPVKAGQYQCLSLLYELNDTVHITIKCTKTWKAN